MAGRKCSKLNVGAETMAWKGKGRLICWNVVIWKMLLSHKSTFCMKLC